MGYLDGDMFSIQGNLKSESVRISMQEVVKGDLKTLPSYAFTSTGDFTNNPGVVDLNVRMNDRVKHITCVKLSK